ncbi:MAG: hypothetical protein PUI85_04885 [Eubacteriales bacterium]|nr:hypothetical protein [Eubacteriales bacterium]MDY3332435.1 hypothetical protein [Gallibacter sp.]
MENEKLYIKNKYLKIYTTKVGYVGDEGVVFDKTIFFPGGGGQPEDKGFVLLLKNNYQIPTSVLDSVKEKYNNIDIYEDKDFYNFLDAISGLLSCDSYEISKINSFYEYEDLIFHKLDKIEEMDIREGDSVILFLNWNNRRRNMQRHSGEHIVSGLFWKYYKAANKGFHMGDHYVTIDLKSQEFPVITWDMVKKIEYLANKTIWDNVDIATDIFENKAEASIRDVRKDINIDDGEISVVTIGNTLSPIDCVACCGTHPNKTGEIGIIKIFKLEKNKDMWRLYLDCGYDAYEDYRQKHNIVTKLCEEYSADRDSLEEALRKKKEQIEEERDNLFNLKKKLQRIYVNEIINAIQTKDDSVWCDIFSYDDVDASDLIEIGNNVAGVLRQDNYKNEALVLITEKDSVAMLWSLDEKINAGGIVKAMVLDGLGKGGGNVKFARLSYNKDVDDIIKTFQGLLKNL